MYAEIQIYVKQYCCFLKIIFTQISQLNGYALYSSHKNNFWVQVHNFLIKMIIVWKRRFCS